MRSGSFQNLSTKIIDELWLRVNVLKRNQKEISQVIKITSLISMRLNHPPHSSIGPLSAWLENGW